MIISNKNVEKKREIRGEGTRRRVGVADPGDKKGIDTAVLAI